MDNYLDFGSDSDSPTEDLEAIECDSDEEERICNNQILKMLNASYGLDSKKTSRNQRNIDDFEAEMEAELDKRALEVEAEGGVKHQTPLSRSSSSSSLNKLQPSPSSSPKPGSSNNASSSSCQAKKMKKSVTFKDPNPNIDQSSCSKEEAEVEGEFYDKIYFDSDESEGEDEETKVKRKKNKKFLSNDDLFYDPTSDEKDQAWVDKKRRKYIKHPTEMSIVTSENDKEKAAIPLPNSDAVLNCPACFTLLCLDCQRHEFYTGQYRAMFVTNCIINKGETLKIPLKEKKGKGKKHGENSANSNELNYQGIHGDSFHPVKCKVCNTQVAVYDTDEVFHFFNILASYA